jgi:hypothetical protein
MISKIFLMILLFGTFFIIDLVYFFPVLIVILLVLRSIEKDLKLKERNH